MSYNRLQNLMHHFNHYNQVNELRFIIGDFHHSFSQVNGFKP